jgi:hypothetical protein
MKRYLAYTGRMAAATPASRNRVVDFWRVLALGMVMCGHWLIASIWVRPDGSRALMNSLEWIPYAGWVTWLFQIMPVFFLVGGYANARALGRVTAGTQSRRDWITRRARRLVTPVLPLFVVWAALILIMRRLVSPEEVRAGVIMATMPVWFLAVYLTLSALAPFTHACWRRRGPWTLAILAAAAIGVDVARFAFGVPVIGWVNFAFVWALMHQVGYWWADRDDRGGAPRMAGWPLAAGALGVLVAVTWTGLYPVAMVSIPGQGVANMTPPTSALALLGLVQFGIIVGTQPAVRRLVARARVWHAVVSLAGVAMTTFLWHLTAMMLAVGIGLFAFDGAVFRVAPGTTLWWATRPLWFLAAGLMTLPFVALLAGFERRISTARPPATRLAVSSGVLLAAGACAAAATLGMADRLGQWIIPAAALAGAALLGALPARPRVLLRRRSGP